MAVRGAVIIASDRCKGCELCIKHCPQGVLQLANAFNARGYRPVKLVENGKQCTGCGVCAVICPDVVFQVFRETHRARAQAA